MINELMSYDIGYLLTFK